MILFISDECGKWFYVECSYCGWKFLTKAGNTECPRCGCRYIVSYADSMWL